MKIVAVTCYSNPDYIRARTLRAGLKADKRVRLIVVKNEHKSILRYPEIIWKLLRLRYTQNPDAYLLTFRGQEILPFVLWLAGRRPVVFDEFIVPIALARSELSGRSLVTVFKHFLAYVSTPFYSYWLRRCKYVLADTPAHADFSARTSNINLRQYRYVPIGADEKLFYPSTMSKTELTSLPFQVFFYAKSWAISDLQLVLSAAEQLKNKQEISFLIAGGGNLAANAVQVAQEKGSHLIYRAKIPVDELPSAIRQSALALAGPFSTTTLAQHIVTDKSYQFLACAVASVVGQNEATMAVFTDKDNVLMVPLGDDKALARTINWAASNRDTLVDIGRNGRHLYEKSLSQARINDQLSKLVDNLS
jgi:glycosyltransferase involved in cell wall biosynthesis